MIRAVGIIQNDAEVGAKVVIDFLVEEQRCPVGVIVNQVVVSGA